jgi:hypothetical protein
MAILFGSADKLPLLHDPNDGDTGGINTSNVNHLDKGLHRTTLPMTLRADVATPKAATPEASPTATTSPSAATPPACRCSRRSASSTSRRTSAADGRPSHVTTGA